jgi:anti-anti-sigma factor
MIRIEEQKRKCKAYIEGEMTIYTAMELKEKLLPIIQDSRELEINLSKVNEIDSAGVQLLMLAKKNRCISNYALNLTDHSSAVLDVFELMNLVAYFNDPVVLQGLKGEKHGT